MDRAVRPFEYFIEEQLVRKTRVDRALINSLIERSMIRLNLISNQEISALEAPIIFEQIYESIREAAQALMQKEGFKPFSHEAIISFLNKQKFDPSIVNKINKQRILRNKSVYEAYEISPETCISAIKFAKDIVPKIRRRVIED